MSRLKPLFGALMLALMLWTSGLAQAAEPVVCVPSAVEAPGHFDGDGDETPSDREPGVAHHHAGCSGHQIAAPAELPQMIPAPSSANAPRALSEARLSGHIPDRQLRPPIA